MKKLTGNIVSHLLYWFGHLFCFFAEHLNGWGYRPYGWLMNASISVQEWGSDGPWETPPYGWHNHD